MGQVNTTKKRATKTRPLKQRTFYLNDECQAKATPSHEKGPDIVRPWTGTDGPAFGLVYARLRTQEHPAHVPPHPSAKIVLRPRVAAEGEGRCRHQCKPDIRDNTARLHSTVSPLRPARCIGGKETDSFTFISILHCNERIPKCLGKCVHNLVASKKNVRLVLRSAFPDVSAAWNRF
ncbi:hypothetical protein NDU88_001380 [Pleurodeles waltl]|uniref:Uncharacterized protein n=1 Tax=Pleurodeles waltl TaxID=8319 RepID=A0AAV7L9A8_PLEWA|nr:hypothetical protein NDU88_001380 [Pleurodeles waltl]